MDDALALVSQSRGLIMCRIASTLCCFSQESCQFWTRWLKKERLDMFGKQQHFRTTVTQHTRKRMLLARECKSPAKRSR